MMPMGKHLPVGAFNSEVTRLLGSAFEDAWQKLTASEAALADKRRAASIRELLAKRIIELGRRGERNHDRLVEHALAQLAGSNATPDVAGRHLN
jgi:hypothetical protein